jgi:hypothetical protein
MIRPNAKTGAEYAYSTRIGAVECRCEYQQSARLGAVPEVEGTSIDSNHTKSKAGTCELADIGCPSDEGGNLPRRVRLDVEVSSDPQVQSGRECLTDRDLIDCRGIGGPTCDNTISIHHGAEPRADGSADLLKVRVTFYSDAIGTKSAHCHNAAHLAQLPQLNPIR